MVVLSPPGITKPSRPSRCAGEPDFHRVGAQPAQHPDVLAERPLQGEDAYPGENAGSRVCDAAGATNHDAG